MVRLGEGIGGCGSSQDQDRESAGGGCRMHRISNVSGVLRVRGMLERSDLGCDTLLTNGRQVGVSRRRLQREPKGGLSSEDEQGFRE
jgi:hypothetical protein